MAEEKEGVTIPIIAPQQFLLDYLVLVGRKRTRQIMFTAGSVLAENQTRQAGEVFGPGQFLQHAAQMVEADGISDRRQRRLVRA